MDENDGKWNWKYGWSDKLNHFLFAEGKVVNAEDVKEPHEDSDKINVPDPSMNEEQQEKEEPLTTEGDDQSMMEGAWADILGSGQLKKKVITFWLKIY